MTVGRLKRVPLREVWKHEAIDFSKWLEENVDILNEILDVNLTNVERERAAGDFSVDLVGEDENGNAVVIENQLEKSDHDHLGKVLTYLAALDASAAVWIVAKPRPEHVKAVAWLNESTSTPFYLVQVEAVRIGDSAPAPLLTKIVGPSEEARAAGETKKELSERHHQRRRFWTLLLDYARTKTSLHANIAPNIHSWLGTGSGLSGIQWGYTIRQHDARVDLYIDRGNEEENKKLFDRLFAHREEVDTAFGTQLEWHRQEGRRSCRISHPVKPGGWRDEDRWQSVAEAMTDAMIRLEAALGPKLVQLKRNP